MVAVSDARGGADSLVLDNIVHHASPELMNVMRAKYDPTRSNYLRHADELAQFAQLIEHGSGAEAATPTPAKHYDYGGGSNRSQSTPSKNPARLGKWSRGKKTSEFVLAIGDADKSDQRGCILGSGASRHLVSDEQQLVDSRECNKGIAMADGVPLQLTRCSSVRLNVIENGAAATVTHTNVYLAPRLAKNIVSYGKL
uniref:Retrovirus-related Pol polyprotein from transposon TNT 1-94-like beta-barrel domain-containing protein n=1 Tax=Peronospora matthiolae TaxID=2874970 RepID=A0AAV1U2V5_9STRA